MTYFIAPGISNYETLEMSVIRQVCNSYTNPPSFTQAIMTSQKRLYVEIRQISMTLLVLKHKYTLQRVADFFKKKDHSTVIHAMETVANLYETNKIFRENIMHLFIGINMRKKRKYGKKQG